MTLSEKEIKFTEAMGWRTLKSNVSKSLTCAWESPEGLLLYPPNYPEDLNAMHEAILTLSDVPYINENDMLWSERCEFVVQLERVVLRDKLDATNFDIYNATALQRFEAMGQALGLWQPTPKTSENYE